MADKVENLLQVEKIDISFPGVKALDGVDFRLLPGEVHALMGQNGAGKSTLIKVLTGVHKPDSGRILLGGKPVNPESPAHAEQLGISAVYQEVNLCPNLSVAENMMIGREPRRGGMIDWGEMRRRAEAALEEKLDLRIDVTRSVASYSVAVQQMVAIARSLMSASRILILDEPTSSLDDSEVEHLFAVVRKLRADGMGILFITHFLWQAYEISDRITVLRNGTLIGEWETAKLPRLELISRMVGKDMSDLDAEGRAWKAKPAAKGSVPVAELRGAGKKGLVNPIDLKVGKGEALGLAGLLGSGRTETAKMLFGLEHPDTGKYLLEGRPAGVRSPKQALDAGLGFCPEDRKTEAVFGDFTIRENIVLALQARQGAFRHIGRKQQNKIADEYIAKLGIKTPSPEQQLSKLSGGNQQKVILARWLLTEPRLLILDEPTRGIDVSAKAEIQKLILELCSGGMSIVFISSELEEVARVSSRVAVMRDREKIAELPGEGLEEADILRTIAKGDSDGL